MDLFENAQKFYQENPLSPEKDPNYLALAQELYFIVETASFLSAGEKKRLKDLIGIMSVPMLERLKAELVSEGVTYHQNYHDPKTLRWLKLIVSRHKAIKK